MNEKPEALRLADALDDLMGEETLIGAVHIDKASYELRRLHKENKRLREEGTKFHSNITFIGHFPGSESVEVMRLTRNGIWANPDVEIDNTAKIVLAALDVQLKELVQKAVAAEREACELTVDSLIASGSVSEVQQRHNWAYMHARDAIRARGEQEKPR